MMMALPLLSVLALSGYVTIDGVSAGAADSKVTVEVKTSAPVETGDVRSKFANGMMQLYLDGGHARADRRLFKNEGLEASVQKRTGYAKVEVPLAVELGCVGPVAVTAGETGFTATIKCSGAEGSASSTSTSTKVEAPAEKAVAPSPKAEPAVAKAEVATAKVEVPAEVEAAHPTATATATATTTAEVKAAPVAAAAAPVAPAPAAAPIATSKSSSAMMFPAFVLIGLGVAAYYFKKRQTKKTSLIEILETAQIGPKRQLVVARVNGETMVLGSSEAGITCLTGMHRLPTMGSEGTMSSIFQVPQMQIQESQAVPPPLPPSRREQFVPFDPPPAQGSGNEFVDEGGILTRLFRARGQEKPQEKFENIELHEFDNLLQESVADQELRHKLSAGFRGKVS